MNKIRLMLQPQLEQRKATNYNVLLNVDGWYIPHWGQPHYSTNIERERERKCLCTTSIRHFFLSQIQYLSNTEWYFQYRHPTNFPMVKTIHVSVLQKSVYSTINTLLHVKLVLL